MTETEIDALVDSLDEYDEQRVRAAIETARDPAVGPQLLDRLDEMLNDDSQEADRLARAALAVVVAEADVPEAFDDLFDRLLDGGGDFIDDIVEYVLCRQGERTVRAAINHLAEESEPGARGVLYTLLQSAHGRDPALVADAVAACHREWAEERVMPPEDENDKTGWTPAISLCYALAVLGDGSVRQMIADELGKPRRKEHRINWTAAATYAEKHLGQNPFDAERETARERKATYLAGRDPSLPPPAGPAADPDDVYADDDLDWRQDWTVQLPRWAKVYDPAEQDKSFESFRDQMAPLRAMIERLAGERAAANPDNVVIEEDDFHVPPPDEVTMPIKAERKVGRNDPCPCGSGKKYKKCHGAAGGTG